tara:strand:+ start:65 stop:487 length:423 start_codon:yes stop_codon:yes gene_type:complete
MTDKFKIIANYIKDLSSETKDIETYIFVKNQILKYQLGININSKAIKNKMIEINTIMKLEDKEDSEKKSFFEMTYTSIVKIGEDVRDKQELEKIILCDVQSKITPNLEKSFLDMLHNSGFNNMNFENKLDFEKLYKQRAN